MIRGKGLFSRSDILAALTTSTGDINQALTLLRPPPEEPPLSATVPNAIGIDALNGNGGWIKQWCWIQV